MMRALVQAKPHRPDLVHDLLISLSTQASWAKGIGRDLEAFELDKESLPHRRAEVEPRNRDASPGLARFLFALGKLAAKRGRAEEALGCFEEGLAIARVMVDADPANIELRKGLALATRTFRSTSTASWTWPMPSPQGQEDPKPRSS